MSVLSEVQSTERLSRAPGTRCTICDNSQVELINLVLAANVRSIRYTASQFGVSWSALQRHKQSGHVTQSARAHQARKEVSVAERFNSQVDFLFSEGKQYVTDAHKAIKYVPTGDGEYTKLRDLGAMSPAISAAVATTELFGKTHGLLDNPAGATVNVMLNVGIPRVGDDQVGPTIDVPAIESNPLK